MSEEENQSTDELRGAVEGTQPLSDFSEGAAASTSAVGSGKIDLDLLMDVKVGLSVEIGRTRMPIKDLVALNQGSIVELERDVNDLLDLMVNGTLIARGEVVEANGKFGLRLIDVISPAERLKQLK